MEGFEKNLWSRLPREKREKSAEIMIEFSAMAVSWNDAEKEQIFQVFSEWIKVAQDDYKIKPHQLIIISQMLQETAFADLIDWLPEDFDAWADKDELMAMFFFGQKGLESYREEKKRIIS